MSLTRRFRLPRRVCCIGRPFGCGTIRQRCQRLFRSGDIFGERATGTLVTSEAFATGTIVTSESFATWNNCNRVFRDRNNCDRVFRDCNNCVTESFATGTVVTSDVFPTGTVITSENFPHRTFVTSDVFPTGTFITSDFFPSGTFRHERMFRIPIIPQRVIRDRHIHRQRIVCNSVIRQVASRLQQRHLSLVDPPQLSHSSPPNGFPTGTFITSESFATASGPFFTSRPFRDWIIRPE